MLVLITGANGRTSRHVIQACLSGSQCPPLRALVHSQTSKGQLASAFPQLLSPPHDIVVADYLTPPTLFKAFEGVTIVFHNGPCFHPFESAMGVAVIDAAKQLEVTPHFVFCSVLHPFRTKLLNHKSKMTIEEYLLESKLDYTILQPTQYMQNADIAAVRKAGLLPLGYSTEVTHGFVDLMDVALVARKVIHAPRSHNLARYELVGQNISYASVLGIMSTAMGKRISCEELSSKESAAQLVVQGTKSIHDEYSRDAAERMILYYNRWGLTGSPNTLRWLLGREPTTWQEYLRRQLQG